MLPALPKKSYLVEALDSFTKQGQDKQSNGTGPLEITAAALCAMLLAHPLYHCTSLQVAAAPKMSCSKVAVAALNTMLPPTFVYHCAAPLVAVAIVLLHLANLFSQHHALAVHVSLQLTVYCCESP